MSEEGNALSRWHPPIGVGKALIWVALLNAVAALLTNGYYLRFLEPAVPRGVLVLASILVAGGIIALARYGVPSSWKGLVKAARAGILPILLVTILGTAFALRLWGISYGLPQSYVPDEYDYVASALTRLKTGDFNPRWWYYPSLQPYLCSATYLSVFLFYVSSGRWSSIHQVVEEDMLYWGRFLSVGFGTLAVLLTFVLGRRLFGTRVGLLAAALLAVFPGAVEHSQYNKPDAVLCFAVVASVLVTLAYFEKGGSWYALACGVAIGLAASSKYNGVLVAVPFVLAVALRRGRQMLSRPDFYLGLGGAVLTFAAVNPYFLADFPRFIDHVAFDIYSYSYMGRPGAEGQNNWWTHAKYTAGFGAGLPASLLGMVGLALLLYRLDARATLFLSFPILFYSYYSAQRINWAGNLITVYSFLAILAAYGMDLIGAALFRPRRVRRFMALEPYAVAAILVIAVWRPLGTTVDFNRQLTLPDTGNQAREWMNGSFPPGTHFAVERHAPVPERKKFKITQEARIIRRAIRDYRQMGVQYLVLSSMVYARFGPEHRVTSAYEEVFAVCPLVKEFKPIEGKVQGPTIRILSVSAK